MKTKAVIIALVLLVFTGLIYWRKIWKNKFYFSGTIEATRIDLPARVPTIVRTIFVEEGQDVHVGQEMAVLACEELALVNRLANENYERALKLQKNGAISREVFDNLLNRKMDADTKLSWCSIKSPVNGTVLNRYLEPQEWVNPGTKLLTVANLDSLWTMFYVPQEVMSRLSLNQKVYGIIPELEAKTIEGRVSKINQEAEFTPKNVQTRQERTRLVFGIKVLFHNPDRVLKPGMTIESDLMESM